MCWLTVGQICWNLVLLLDIQYTTLTVVYKCASDIALKKSIHLLVMSSKSENVFVINYHHFDVASLIVMLNVSQSLVYIYRHTHTRRDTHTHISKNNVEEIGL